MTNFKRDLDSEPAGKIHREARELNLPMLSQVRGGFEEEARSLGVNAETSLPKILQDKAKIADGYFAVKIDAE